MVEPHDENERVARENVNTMDKESLESEEATITLARSGARDVALRVRDLHKSFRAIDAESERGNETVKRPDDSSENRLSILRGVSFEARAGEMIAIVGASGAGKTTLLQIIGALDRADAGAVEIGGEEITKLSAKDAARVRGRSIGFVFQSHRLLPDLSALENAALPLLIARRPPREANLRAREILERIGLGARLSHRPAQLSGGEQQRVAIARAVITRPRLLLADEPTGNLDARAADEITSLLDALRREKMSVRDESDFNSLNSQDRYSFAPPAVIIATHNERLAAACDRTLALHDGRIKPA